MDSIDLVDLSWGSRSSWLNFNEIRSNRSINLKV